MKRILVSDNLSDEGLAVIREAEDFELDYKPGLDETDLASAVKGAHGLIIRSGSKVTARVIEAADQLKVVGRAGIGVDNIDVPEASKRGIVVMNTPTGNAVTTAEHAISLMMALARNIPRATSSMKAGNWEKKKLAGRELSDKVLAVVGLGNIGRLVADRGKGLHMRVIGFDPVMTEERATALGVELVDLETVWKEADVITVHTPLTPQTEGLVNDEVVDKLKPGVLLVNCARGGIYDEAALLKGLESGKIGGVALDVYPKEPPPADAAILAHDRVICTPHLGASTKEAQTRVAVEIAEQVVDFLDTGEIRNGLNVPSMSKDLADTLDPWVELAQGLGRFLAQVEKTDVSSLEIECTGDLADLDIRAVVAGGVGGFLEHFLELPVNAVSAPHLAQDRGIAVKETRSAVGHEGDRVLLRAVDKDGRTHLVAGALGSDGTPRLVRWGDFDIEARLEGTALVIESDDQPGVIGFMGATLGKAGINVASLYLGKAPGETGPPRALSVWNLDGKIPPSVIDAMAASDQVARAALVQLS